MECINYVDVALTQSMHSKKKHHMNNKYEIIIYWSKDDDSFIAEVPELAGCSSDGKTHKEALSNVEVVINEWIETAKELNRSIPEPKGHLMLA